jgi:Sec-independent protein translocase protein TatA
MVIANIRLRDLRKSLQDLRALSNTTTSRLDNTYYTVLETFSTLQSSITSLKELSLLASQLDNDFNNESESITKEIQEQLDGFEGFDAQQKNIETMQYRIQSGREKVKKLADRVEVVRKKEEAWAKVEGQWQKKTRKRIRLFWSLSAICLVVLLGILIFQYTPGRTPEAGPDVAAGISGLQRDLLNESLTLKRQASSVIDEIRKVPDAASEDEPRLRAFDEL